MKSFLSLIAVATLLLSNAALAQHKSVAPAGYVDFTPVRLTLGMPKDRTIALLSEHYDVSRWKGGDIEDSWGVSEKTGHHFVTGSLSFVNGVLIRAARFWDVEDSAYSLSHTLSLFDLPPYSARLRIRQASVAPSSLSAGMGVWG